jgi:hypothetical protein
MKNGCNHPDPTNPPYCPDNPYIITFHYTLHGVHHAFPMDKERLVFPIPLGIPMYCLMYYLFQAIIPAILLDAC